MNEYIFYTTEGFTEAPNANIAIDNCQVIGRAHGTNEKEALNNLIAENEWILEAGFDPSSFITQQLMTEELLNSIAIMIDFYLANKNLSCVNSSIEDAIRHLMIAIHKPPLDKS